MWKNATYAPAVVSHGITRSANVKIRYALIVALDLLKPSSMVMSGAFLGRAISQPRMNQCCMGNCFYLVNVFANIKIVATRCIW
jgi:hypothetical protein